MRLCLGIILLIFCLFVGYCLSNKYYFRRMFYSDFLNFNIMLSREIAFKQTTIIDIIKRQNNSTDFYNLLKSNILGEKFEINSSYLTTQEKDFVYEYLEQIGRFDKATQLEYLKSLKDIILDKLNSSILDEKKYKTLYVKLSFLIGLILLIIVL